VKRDIPRGAMSERERRLRSKAAQLLAESGLLHGSLTVRERTCGKPGCRCARGEKHQGLYLSVRREGKVRQLFVPRELEEMVREWVSADQQVRDALIELSDINWDRIQRKKTDEG